jgi:hypothetical protein
MDFRVHIIVICDAGALQTIIPKWIMHVQVLRAQHLLGDWIAPKLELRLLAPKANYEGHD